MATAKDIRIGEIIRAHRVAKGWEQVDLGHKSKIPQPEISRIENGVITLGKKRAKRLAKALRIKWQILMALPVPSSKPRKRKRQLNLPFKRQSPAGQAPQVTPRPVDEPSAHTAHAAIAAGASTHTPAAPSTPQPKPMEL